MPKKVTMEVFRAGTQTDSLGRTEKFTESDLDKIIAKFNEIGEDIPATIGHPDNDTAPAFGWFKKFFRKGDTLFAELGDIVDEFGVMLKNKMFKNRSIAFRKDFSPVHIAFLGGTPPAVKGLENFAFKADDKFSTYEFAEIDEKTLFDKFKNLFKELSDKTEFKPTEDDMSKELEAKITDLEKKFSDQSTTFTTFKTESEAKEKKFAEELTAEKKRADDAEAKIATSGKDALKKEFSDYLDGLIDDGILLPASKPMYLNTMETLHGQEAMTFGEGDKKEKVTQLDVFKKTLEAQGQQVQFGEAFSKGQGPKGAGAQLKIEAKKIQKENEGMQFGEALQQAYVDFPELTAQYQKTGE